MDVDFLLAMVVRWLHILAAITAVGGAIFMRVALMPSAATLPEEEHAALRERIRERWAKVVALSIVLLLGSGIYNIVKITASDLVLPGYYHPLFGVKFLLALGVFFIASALTGKSPGLAKMRENARFYLTLNVAMAVLLVCLSGVLRTARDRAEREPPEAAASDPGPVGSAAA